MGNGSYLATVWEQEEEVAQCAMEEEIYALGISEKVEGGRFAVKGERDSKRGGCS